MKTPNNIPKTVQHTESGLEEAQFGRAVARLLEQGSSVPASAHLQSALFLARQKALAHQRNKSSVLTLAGAGHYFVSTIHEAWKLLAMLLLIVFLVAGYQHWRTNVRAAELAELDTALLTSDLPLNAYLDHGFDTWLNNSK